MADPTADDPRKHKITLGWISETCAQAHTTVTREQYLRMAAGGDSEVVPMAEADEDAGEITRV